MVEYWWTATQWQISGCFFGNSVTIKTLTTTEQKCQNLNMV